MNNIIIKIQALFAALCMFIIGTFYPNTVPKVEFTVDISVRQFSYSDVDNAIKTGHSVQFKIKGKNVGNPFKGESILEPQITVYTGSKDDMKIVNYHPNEYNDAVESVQIPVMKNQSFECEKTLDFMYRGSSIESGTYNVKITVYGNTQYFENAFVIE